MPLYPAMTNKTSPEVAAAIRAKLAYLRRRKAVLDDLIRSLERYSAPELPLLETEEKSRETPAPLAGAA